MSELKSNIDVKIGSERNFGLVFSFVFFIIGVFPLLSGGAVAIWSLVIAAFLLIVSVLWPKILSVPNKMWFKFGMKLGSVVAPIVMAMVYFIAVVPIGLVFKLIGKDLLKKKADKNSKSYWLEKQQSVSSMKDQF